MPQDKAILPHIESASEVKSASKELKSDSVSHKLSQKPPKVLLTR